MKFCKVLEIEHFSYCWRSANDVHDSRHKTQQTCRWELFFTKSGISHNGNWLIYLLINTAINMPDISKVTITTFSWTYFERIHTWQDHYQDTIYCILDWIHTWQDHYQDTIYCILDCFSTLIGTHQFSFIFVV
jgi:hypothetical protein